METSAPARVRVPEAARLLGFHEETVRKWIREGRIRVARELGRVYITEAEIARVRALETTPPIVNRPEKSSEKPIGKKRR